MKQPRALFILLLATLFKQALAQPYPEDYHELQEPIPFAAMEERVAEWERHAHITVESIGRSALGRQLYQVKVSHGGSADWKVMLIGLQHGDEPAGKDALIYLIDDLARNPAKLPRDAEIYIIPMLNPDGDVLGQRRNANNFDLNRDHQILSQPETRALHRAFRQIKPHVVVDCHEFRRDSQDYLERGWTEWPIIMMDAGNHPNLPDSLYDLGVAWVERMTPHLSAAGHPYQRYVVGDAPPHGELRYSTTDVDDARNGLGQYGVLSFIIESGIYRKSENPRADLGQRIDAYLILLHQLIDPPLRHREEALRVINEVQRTPLPASIATNHFWGSVGLQTKHYPVVDQETNETIFIPTTQFMEERIVKQTTTIPDGYIIMGDDKTLDIYADLLTAHGLNFDRASYSKDYLLEACILDRIESDYDEQYNRYEERQIVSVQRATSTRIAKGSLFVPLEAETALRTVLLLEPSQLFGLYQHARFKDLTQEGAPLPVYRWHTE